MSVARAKSSVSLVEKALDKTRHCGWFVLVVNNVRLWMKKLFNANEYAIVVTDLVKVQLFQFCLSFFVFHFFFFSFALQGLG